MTSGSRKLCMAACLFIILIFMGFGEAKGWGDALKSLFGMAVQAARRDSFNGKGGSSLCNTAVLKLYCKSYWVL